MRIVGFSCCVNYSDMLALTYPFNKFFFDEYVISTSTTDSDTIKYCADNSIPCVITDSYKNNGASFNKGAMLNEALKYLYEQEDEDTWFVSLDVDIIVDFLNFDRSKEFNKDFIYGCKRKIIDNKDFVKNGITLEVLRNDELSWEQLFLNPYASIGYFQMFNKRYFFQEKYLTASECDTDFFYDNFSANTTYTFKPHEIICYHLGPIETNWSGRESESWENVKCVI